MYTLILAVAAIVVFYFLHRLKNLLHFREVLDKFPGRKCNFFLGDVLQFSKNRAIAFRTYREYAKEFPEGYRQYGGQYGLLNFILAEDVEVVLSSPKHIEKTLVYGMLEPWLGTGLLTSKAKKWSHRRKILTPAFHFNILRRFITVFNERCNKFISELKEECNKPKTNVVPIINTLALNIICETAMGINVDSYDKQKMDEYRKAIHEIGHLIVVRTFSPWLYSDLIYYFTSAARQERKYIKQLHKFTTTIIKERERTFNESEVKKISNEEDDIGPYSKKRFAMLDLLLLAKAQGEIDDAGIREEVDTFTFEGHDTVSMALSYCLFALANHKDVQEKARAEVDKIFKGSTRSAEYRDLQSMYYVEMVIKESLRLYPSVPIILRNINEDVPFRNGKYTIPKGCLIQLQFYDLHRNASVFPDPEKFDPDRFLPENVKGRHPYAYVPFSAGPRNCIGQKFALLEMKCVISSILRHYEIEPVDTIADLDFMLDLILRPANGLHVKFKPRLNAGLINQSANN